MDEMTRSKVQLQRIADDKLRQDLFAKRKQGLFKKAMELSVLCDCDVGLIIFGPGASGPGTGGQRLYQYSSVCMDELLERYAAAVAEPHERRRNGELLRHYYELSPDEDGEEDAAVRNGDGSASTSVAAAAAAVTMAAVDSIILGGGGRRGDGRDGASGLLKRMRLHSPGFGGMNGAAPASDHLPGPGGQVRSFMGGPAITGLPGPGVSSSGGAFGNGMGPLMPPGAGPPLRRVGAVGGGLPLEGIKAAGFLDKRNYPVSPRSEKAYEELTAEFDKLTELRSQRGGNSGRQSTVLQPLSSSAAAAAGAAPFSLAAQQQHLQQFLHQQQILQQQRQQQQGGGAKRFKPLSILVPEIQTHPIIPTNLTPLNPSSASAVGPAASAANSEHLQAGANGPDPHRSVLHQQPHQQPQSSPPFNSSLQHPHQHQQFLQHQAGLPPRPPVGRLAAASRPPSTQPQGAVALAVSTSTLQGGRGLSGGASSPGPMAISPTTAAVGPPFGGANGPGEPGSLASQIDIDGGTAGGGAGSVGGAFALDRRGGMMSDDGLGSLLGASAFRTSLDGSAANLLAIPSPPPHGAHALFGSLDGGPLSMRSSSHGMLGSLSSLDRGASLGLGGLAMSLESPGGTLGLDTTLRGLGPMDMLEWPSSSPRSSAGNGDGLASGDGSGGGFPDEGEGGTVLDGLIVRGTALSKLAPEAREAAIGPSPDTSGGGGTPVSARARMPLSAFSGAVGALAATFTAAAGPSPEAAASALGSAQAHDAQSQQHGGLAAQGSACSRGAPAAMEVVAGGNAASGTASARHEAMEQAPGLHGQTQAPGRSIATAGSLGLAPELSLNELGFGGPGSVAAAAAAAQAQQGEGQSQGGVGSEAAMGLEVVGKALSLPNGAGVGTGGSARDGDDGYHG